MRLTIPSMPLLIVVMALLTACKDEEQSVTFDATVGSNPQLPAPDASLIPTVNIAPAVGWSGTAEPVAAKGLQVSAFAQGLDHPRWLYVLPNGDVLVAETNAPRPPPDSEESGGIKQWVMQEVMEDAGATVPSANRITLLRDRDGDGEAELRTVFLQDLNSPFGMVLVGNEFYVANADALMKFPYTDGQTQIEDAGTKVVELPGWPLNHHWTKNVVASPDGDKLYVAVGSNSNIAENGFDKERERAAIWEIDRATGEHRIYASGLRNPVGMAWVTPSNALWVAVNERDGLGNNLVPDYMTAVREGGFYGWPYSYFGQNIDERVEQREPGLVQRALQPDYALGSHTASLGLAFANGNQVIPELGQGMFVGQHGSWNREPRSGYKVIFVPFKQGRPEGKPQDVLTGFINSEGDAFGRPVGVAMDVSGDLLVADDVGNTVWRVTGGKE